ncbi:unnamed protein product, partial [Candidula unifasciata]
VDLAIVYHLSQKIKPGELKKYFVPFLVAAVEKANIDNGDVRVALVSFARKARVVFNLAKFKTSAYVIKKINEISPKERAKRSSGGSALSEVRTKIFTAAGGDRDGVPNVILLVTDAKTSDDQKDFLREAATLIESGVKIITVGVKSADAQELRSVSSPPVEEHAVFAKSYSSIAAQEIITSIHKAIPALNQVDLAFVIHFEPRRSQEEWNLLISYIQSIVETADVSGGRVRVSLYFDGSGTAFRLNRYNTNEELLSAIGRLTKNYASATRFDLLTTLRRVRSEIFVAQNGDRENVPNAVIIITDTNSGQDKRRISEEKTQLAQAGIGVYSFGIGLRDKAEIEGIAFSAKNVFSFSDYGDLQQYGSVLKKEIGALNTRQVSGRVEETKVTQPPAVIATEKAEVGTSCTGARIDLVFVLDASTSVTAENFDLIKDFIKVFLYEAEIDGGTVRVGLLIYSTDVHIQFHLNQYKTKVNLFNAIDDIPYRHGSTNTADGLKVMRTEMFTSENGDRRDVDNIAIVITDGISNINARRVLPEAEQARAVGIHIYAIGIGLTDTRELDGIASKPLEKNRFTVSEFSELNNLKQNIFASICEGKNYINVICFVK